MRNGRAEIVGDRLDGGLAEISAHDIATEGQWEPLGLIRPPFAEIEPQMKAPLGIRELSLVDEQAKIDVPLEDGVFDDVEWRHDRSEIRLIQLKSQVRGRQCPRNRDPPTGHRGFDIVGRLLEGYHSGAISVAE